jgi:1,5-anhydro-D-fructose reductase (1,5-anhydro-D-mannitol-forming)
MRKIGVGLVGAGWMGKTLLQRLTERDDVRICGLYQRTRERAHEVLREMGLAESLYFNTYEDMLSDPEVEAVFLCSTNEAHGPQAILAQVAGKHLFCEKPCATVFADFCRQIELERERPEQVTFVDYLMNFDSLENEIREMAARGDFGTITQIQVNYRHPINIEGDKAWKLSKDRMGDAIGMGIIHSLSVMVNIMAEQGADPVSIYATSSEVHSRPFDIPAIWNLQIQFSNGAAGFCFGNVDQANGYDAYHNVHGTGGGLIFDSYLDREQKVRFWSNERTDGKWVYPLDADRCRRENVSEHIWPEDTTTPDSGDVVTHQTAACVDHFLECIQSGRQSFLSFANTASIAELGWAAQISVARRAPVALPLGWGHARSFFESI